MTVRNQTPSGLSTPLRTTLGGRLKTVKGDEQIDKLLAIALRACPSTNPFQSLDITGDIPFSLNNEETVARVKMKLSEVSARFETIHRAKILMDSLWIEKSIDGSELHVHLKYINLETDTESDLNMDFVSQIQGA